MNLERLRADAFNRCQNKFEAPVIVPVPALDPPRNGGLEAEGLVYQEELEVRTTNLLDQDGFYFSPRPRVAVNTIPMDIFVDAGGEGVYQRKGWEDANPDYSSGKIKPPIDRSALPPEARVLTELIVGKVSPKGDYPQLFDIRSSAYLRFSGFPPQVAGGTHRLGAHGVFQPGEDFPIVRSLYVSVKKDHGAPVAHAFVVLESRLFCAALSVDMNATPDRAELVVDGSWYTREDFDWQKDPHTGFAAYSSMLWKTERQTPERDSDEAHDSDTLIARWADGTESRLEIQPPSSGLRVRDLSEEAGRGAPVEWSLANEDRDPAHYADFKPALGDTNYDLRASYGVTVLESSVKTGLSLYEGATDGEYADNIVALSTVREDIRKAQSPEQFVHFKYRTTAFFP